MRDELVRAITADGLVKAVAVTGRDLVERARGIHTLLPMATAALGRTLLAASMMGDMLKIDGASLTLQIKGGGPLGTVLAVSDNSGNVRGYVQDPHVELREKAPGKLDVGWAVGTEGSLTVIKAGVQRMGPVTPVLEQGVDARGLLQAVLSEFQLEFLESHPVEYRCYCSRDRVTRALISMGREELESLIREQGQADLTCQFCDAVYHYTKDDLEAVLNDM